jgi:hypothetical protein
MYKILNFGLLTEKNGEIESVEEKGRPLKHDA